MTTETAYTLGNEENYDRVLAEQAAVGDVVRKTGRGDRGRDPGYAGGWAWRTAGEAEAYRRAHGFALFAVYELELPRAWVECTYMTDDGQAHLLVDAIIVRKVPVT